MKNYFKILFFGLISLLHNPCSSQIYLDTLDLPMFGDVQTTSVVDSIEGISLSPGNSGANVTWDFSAATFCCIDNMNLRWISPQYTVNANFFPLADIVLKTHCYLYHNWQTHVVTEICDNRDYYIKDTSGLKYYGSDYPYPNIVTNYRNVFPLLNYGQTTHNNTRIIIQISADSLFVRNIKDTITADAWGTISTPVDVYDAIRMYTKEVVWDSLYVNGNGILLDYMPDNYYYKWYTYGLGFPVFQISKGILEINKNYQIARAAISKSYEAAVQENSELFTESIAFPNPSNDKVTILFKNKKVTQSFALFVFGLQGNEIMRKVLKSSDEIIITKNDAGKGLFFYKIIFKDGTISMGKFVMN